MKNTVEELVKELRDWLEAREEYKDIKETDHTARVIKWVEDSLTRYGAQREREALRQAINELRGQCEKDGTEAHLDDHGCVGYLAGMIARLAELK